MSKPYDAMASDSQEFESAFWLLERAVLKMEESVTYQAIIRKGMEIGRVNQARRMLLRFGGKKFGPPDATVVAAVAAITELKRLEQLVESVLDANSWQELLTPPA